MRFLEVIKIPTLAFFGADSPRETHCLDCCLVSGVLWWIHVSSTVTKRRKNSSEFRFNNAKHSSAKLSFDCVCEQTRHPSCGKLFHTQVIIQNWNHWATWYPCGFHYPSHFQSPIGQHHVVNFFNHFRCRDLNWVPWTSGIFRTCTARTEFSKPLFTIDIDGAESP